MASTSAVVQDAGVDVQTAVQHFWTLLSMLLGILPIRKLRTRSIIIFFTHQRTSEGIIKLMISQRKMIIGGRKGRMLVKQRELANERAEYRRDKLTSLPVCLHF